MSIESELAQLALLDVRDVVRQENYEDNFMRNLSLDDIADAIQEMDFMDINPLVRALQEQNDDMEIGRIVKKAVLEKMRRYAGHMIQGDGEY